VTFAVNGAIQLAYADVVAKDPLCAGLAEFYQRKRDLFLSAMEGSRFRPLRSQGTFFQLLDYSAITDEADNEFALRLIREHGVASIPLSPFLHMLGSSPGRPHGRASVLRFCFAKQDETLASAAEKLRAV
jgi:methionine aminotransferase